jgi:hypothetical protein
LDNSTIDNFSAPGSKSEDSDDNDGPHASDLAEAMAGAVDPIAMSSSSPGIHKVDEADLQAPENAKELNINDSMSQIYC